MQKIIATDLDGTLFYPKHKIRLIDGKNVKFLQRFIDAGNRVCLVSGRNKTIANKIKRKIGRPVDIIGCNSSFIISDGKMIKQKCFGNEMPEIVDSIYNEFHPEATLLMSENFSLVLDKEKSSKFVGNFYIFWSKYQGALEEKYISSHETFENELKNGKVYKVMLFFGGGQKAIEKARETNKVLREKYPDIECSWSNQVIELTPFGCSKAQGLVEYIDYLGIDRENVYVIGDSGNDVSMFKEFPNTSFCMGQAPAEVKKYAKHVINRVYELGEYLEKGE